MNGLDALKSVQFVTAHGKRFAVLSADDWESLIDWLEEIEDRQTIRQALADLTASNGDRKKAGWLDWSAVRKCSTSAEQSVDYRTTRRQGSTAPST